MPDYYARHYRRLRRIKYLAVIGALLEFGGIGTVFVWPYAAIAIAVGFVLCGIAACLCAVGLSELR